MPPAVSNSGPLIALAKLKALDLLPRLYDVVYIPQAVYDEAVVEGMRRGYKDAFELSTFLSRVGWKPERVLVPQDVDALELDLGEKESIAMAEAKEALLLMDEEKGREEARCRGIKVRGTLGVLVEAYRHELIDESEMRLYFKAIEEDEEIWISPRLCRKVLEAVLGEG